MKDIECGEFITFDWAMVGGPYQERECKCGAPNCRKQLSSEDWKVLHEKYGKYNADFIKRRVKGEDHKEYESVQPYEIYQMPAEDYAILNKYTYNPEIQKEDFEAVKCKIQECKEMEGQQVRALVKIPKGCLVSCAGGRIYNDSKDEEDLEHTVQIHEYLFQGPIWRSSQITEKYNHSCNSNLGSRGAFTMVALRDIEAGEILTYDYSMTDSDLLDAFDCLCQQPNCRGKIGPQDWKKKEIQEKYKGYFSCYIQRLIDQNSE